MTVWRRLTMLREPRTSLQRRAAQKVLGLHRRLAGALQFENPQCTLLAGNREVVVEHVTRCTGPIDHLTAQDLDPYLLAFACHLAPRAGTLRQPVNMPEHGAARLVPVDPRLGLLDLGGIGHAVFALPGELQPAALQ